MTRPRVRLGAAPYFELLRKALVALATIILLSAITFLVTNLRSPESVARTNLGRLATPAQLAEFVREERLGDPLYTRYIHFVRDFVSGDLGSGRGEGRNTTSSDVVARYGDTLLLIAAASVFIMPITFLLAAFVTSRSRRVQSVAATVNIAAGSVPPFVVGIALVLLFSVFLGWLPPDSQLAMDGSLLGRLRSTILPAVTLGLGEAVFLFQLFRADFGDIRRQGYMQSAVLRGTSRWRLLRGHALPNAMPVAIGIAGIALLDMISGTVIVETVFSYPGIGTMLENAVSTGDTLVTQMCVILLGATLITISLVTDWLSLVTNPRRRTAE